MAVWSICVAIALQVIFYFVFQIIGYDSFLLSVTLTASVLAVLVVLVVWNALKRRM
jgi:Na+/melibiose symporter-like transporter